MSDATDFQRMVTTLTRMGMDPQAAVSAVAAGRVPVTDYMEPALPAGLTEDGQRAIAELQNLDRTRNAGNRNRSTIYPLPEPGEYEPLDPRALPMPDDYSPRALPPADPKFTPNPDFDLPPWVTIPADAFTSTMPPSPSLDTYRGMLGFGGIDAPGINTAPGAGAFPGFGPVDLTPPSADLGFRKPITPAAPGAGRGTSGSPSAVPNPEVQAGLQSEDVSPNPMNPLQRWTEEKFGWDEEKRGDIGRALMAGGFATMAGSSPYAMENIGRGGLVGMDAYYDGKDERLDRERQEEMDQMARERHARSMANDSEGQIFADLERAQSLIQMGLDPADFGIDIGRLGIDDETAAAWAEKPMDDVQKLRYLRTMLEADGMTPEQSLDTALSIMGKRASEAGIGGL